MWFDVALSFGVPFWVMCWVLLMDEIGVGVAIKDARPLAQVLTRLLWIAAYGNIVAFLMRHIIFGSSLGLFGGIALIAIFFLSATLVSSVILRLLRPWLVVRPLTEAAASATEIEI